MMCPTIISHLPTPLWYQIIRREIFIQMHYHALKLIYVLRLHDKTCTRILLLMFVNYVEQNIELHNLFKKHFEIQVFIVSVHFQTDS